MAKSEARRQRFAGCPPSPSEPAVSYLNTSYKFFVPRLWKRSGGLGREKSPQWRRGTLERSSTQSKLERRGLKKDPRILDKETCPLSGCLPSGYWLHSRLGGGCPLTDRRLRHFASEASDPCARVSLVSIAPPAGCCSTPTRAAEHHVASCNSKTTYPPTQFPSSVP